MEAADRKRFEFVNGIVKQVEKRKVFTKDKNFQDKVDEIITHKVIGIPIFVAVIFPGILHIPDDARTWIADWLVGWIETFQGWVGGLMENANPLLYALLVDGIIGGVGAVVGFLPLVMVMYFLIALLEAAIYGKGDGRAGSDLQAGGAFRKIRDPHGHRHRLCHPGRYGVPYDPQ